LSKKRALIIGASSGIGREMARQLIQDGWLVAGVARREERLRTLAEEFPGSLLSFVHDVRHFDEAPELFSKIAHELGGLDLVVYASGVMPEVGPREFNTEKDRAMIETNLLGAIAWLNEAATRFENTGHGTIVGIGSVAGDRGRSGQPVYNTSKAALATYLEALRNRLSKLGVTVTTIKPGPVQTEMTQHLGLKGAMPVSEAARRTLVLANRGGEHYLSSKHRLIFYILKRIPSPIFRRLSI
jgi:decaprenylphospho-beta-D-erythro-pentofuranosid-2-ulose 2-reductase